MENRQIIDHTVRIVTSWTASNRSSPEELLTAIDAVHRALRALTADEGAAAAPPQKPAVPIRKSVTPDYIICLEDGRKLKTLKRHLRTVYGMTPDEYRQKWGLPHDYPMAAPNYAAERSAAAKKLGLGRRNRGGARQQAGSPGAETRRRRKSAA